MNLLVDARRVLTAGLLSPSARTIDEFAATMAAATGFGSPVVGSIAFPTSRLEALAAFLTTGMPPNPDQLRITAVIDEPLGSAALRASVFDRYMTPAAAIAALEASDSRFAVDADSLKTAVAGIGQSVVPLHVRDLRTENAATSDVGVVLNLVEARDPEAVTQQLRVACAHTIPLKTYVTGAAWTAATDGNANPYGLVNLLTAVALACDNQPAQVAAALVDNDPAHFRLTRAGLQWRDCFVGIPTLRRARSVLVACGTPDLAATLSELDAAGLFPPIPG